MDWLSFFIGALVGWIIEWLIDLFYWRRRWRSAWQDKERLQARLDDADIQIRVLEAENRDLRVWRQQASETTLAAERAKSAHPDVAMDVDLKAPEVALPGADLDVELEAPEVALPRADLDVDLEVPEVALPRADLDVELEAPEVALPGADLDVGLEAPEVVLPGAEPIERDNLKRIEGIGPKISRLLNEYGILTFAQLAATSPDRLRAILGEAGPNFQLADPGSWPEQASLAADGAWDELQALQNRLIGGRRSPRLDR